MSTPGTATIGFFQFNIRHPAAERHKATVYPLHELKSGNIFHGRGVCIACVNSTYVEVDNGVYQTIRCRDILRGPVDRPMLIFFVYIKRANDRNKDYVENLSVSLRPLTQEL